MTEQRQDKRTDQQKRRKNRIIGLALTIIGLLFILYPLTTMTVNNWTKKQNLESFERDISSLTEEERLARLKEAAVYNEALDGTADAAVDPFAVEGYASPNPLSYGQAEEPFGYIWIPRIDEMLPVYLGASEDHLAKGVAQVDGTALPIGGLGTRSVIAGHRGYANQAMFASLDRMVPGDLIYISVLNQVLIYQVYETEIIQPAQNDRLQAIDGQDTLTLLTCHPYLVNNLRLLVNAVRVGTQVGTVNSGGESSSQTPVITGGETTAQNGEQTTAEKPTAPVQTTTVETTPASGQTETSLTALVEADGDQVSGSVATLKTIIGAVTVIFWLLLILAVVRLARLLKLEWQDRQPAK